MANFHTEPALHLIFKWKATPQPLTIQLHREIAVSQGSVWWGKFGSPSARAAIRQEAINRIRAQIAADVPTWVFLYRAGEVWRTALHAITTQAEEIDLARLPSYYRPAQCNLFVRISDFEQLSADWVASNLVLDSDPDPSKIVPALGNQTTPLQVRQYFTPGPNGDTDAPAQSIQAALPFFADCNRLLEQYPDRPNRYSASAPQVGLLSNLATRFETMASEAVPNEHWNGDSGCGIGVWAETPWIALYDTRETDRASRGVYPVIHFILDQDGGSPSGEPGIRIGLGVSVTEFAGEARQTRVNQVATQLSQSRQDSSWTDPYWLTGSSLPRPTTQPTGTHLGRQYYDGMVLERFVPAHQLATDGDELTRDLYRLLEWYKGWVDDFGGHRRSDLLVVEGNLPLVVQSFSKALSEAHLSYGPQHDSVVRAFIAALAAKRLVILTGLSGSGKTQIALALGRWFGPQRYTVIPVRPDWTGPEALLGYADALQAATEGRRVWHAPAGLEFILRAAADPEHPYLLLLDEMNLAHVERYFADALSGMESDEPCIPNVQREEDGLWREVSRLHERIVFPRNLFVVGTVNVDETTYMFSPKVLDRANTFEFRVAADDLKLDAQRADSAVPGPEPLVRFFLQVAVDDHFQATHPAPHRQEVADHLLVLHGILADGGFEFGHRVFYEALRFAAYFSEAGEPDLAAALDRIVMQKLLPRLHGSHRRLHGLLCALGQYCFDLTQGNPETDGSASFDPEAPPEGTAKLPIAFDKIRRMTRSLRANQFVSFTE